jgi:iron complex outermembrane receptor protein
VGWTRGAYAAVIAANHVRGYDNPLVIPVDAVSSWTTTDLSLTFKGSESSQSHILQGVTAVLSAHNLFDTGPPQIRGNLFGLLYDPTNAEARGRYLSMSLRKIW